MRKRMSDSAAVTYNAEALVARLYFVKLDLDIIELNLDDTVITDQLLQPIQNLIFSPFPTPAIQKEKPQLRLLLKCLSLNYLSAFLLSRRLSKYLIANTTPTVRRIPRGRQIQTF